jgi:hypothetical protein
VQPASGQVRIGFLVAHQYTFLNDYSVIALAA